MTQVYHYPRTCLLLGHLHVPEALDPWLDQALGTLAVVVEAAYLELIGLQGNLGASVWFATGASVPWLSQPVRQYRPKVVIRSSQPNVCRFFLILCIFTLSRLNYIIFQPALGAKAGVAKGDTVIPIRMGVVNMEG